jgi:hypothetical protein
VIDEIREAAKELLESGVDESAIRLAIGTALLGDYSTKELMTRYRSIEELRSIADAGDVVVEGGLVRES